MDAPYHVIGRHMTNTAADDRVTDVPPDAAPLATRVTVVDPLPAEAMQKVPRESAIEKKVENETTEALTTQQR